MQWRSILKEYGHELIYTKGSTNIVADALSRLKTEPTNESIAETKNLLISENLMPCYVVWRNVLRNVVWRNVFPLTFVKIRNVERSDAALLKLLQSNDAYSLKIFHGGGKFCGLIVRNDKL